MLEITENKNTVSKINVRINEYEKQIDEAQKKIDLLRERCIRDYTAEEVKCIMDNFVLLATEYAKEDETINMIGSYIKNVKAGSEVTEVTFTDSCCSTIAS